MGACSNKKSEERLNKNNKTPIIAAPNNYENVYGIKKFGTTIIPIETIDSPLKFEFRISNVKGKNLPDNRYYIVKIIFENPKNTFLLPLSSGRSPHFNFEKYVSLEIPFENMEKSYFELIVYSIPFTTDIHKIKNMQDYLAKTHIFSSLKVDLLTIAIGPEHHDIRLLDKNNSLTIGRISFNISCSHLENIFMDIQNLKFTISHMVKKQIALKLAFNGKRNTIESDYTKPLNPVIHNKEEITIYEWSESPKPIPNSNSHDLCPNKNDPSNCLNLVLRLSMVDLRSSNISLNVYDIKYVDIDSQPREFCVSSKKLLTFNGDNYKGHEMELIAKYTQIGYSTFNFYTILSENDNIITKQSSTFFNLCFSGNNEPEAVPNQIIKFKIFDNVLKTFHEKIFWEGKEVGKVEGIIEIKKIPLIRQVMCGVHTESGFDISSVYLNMESTKFLKLPQMDTSPAELKTLALQKTNLLQSLIKLTGLTYSSSRELTNQIINSMKNIENTLEKSFKESCLYYNYHSNRDLYDSQKIMLDIGINIIKMMESFDLEQRVKGFKILNLLNNRAEFDLGTLWRAWFIDQGTESIFRDSYLIEDKIIENFIEFNNLCLNFSLDGLSRGTLVDKEARTFVEFYLSVAYFRIPKFRNTFLEIISKDLYTEIENENDLGFDKNNIKDFIEIDPVNSLILWENLFYKRLDSALYSFKNHNKTDDNEIKERLKETETIINNDNHKGEWKERLRKRGPAFFSMVVRLENYIRHKVVKDLNIKWLNIPGFNIIIDAILNELKTRDVSAYPQKLCDLLLIFTNDFEIINNFVNVIIGRTNALDANAVFTLVNILESIFADSKFRNKGNNSRFDYSVLKRAVFVMLDLDHCLAIAKFLKLYYNNSFHMNFDHVSEIFIYINQKKFYEFFFHWSWQLRNIFYHLILYIINFQIRNSELMASDSSVGGRRKSFSDTKEVSNYSEMLKSTLLIEYDKKMKIIESVKQHIQSKGLDPSYNTMIDIWNRPEYKEIPIEFKKNIILAMTHYDSVEKYFIKWEAENKKKKLADQVYPAIEVQPPKDDVFEYSDSW